MFDGPKVFSNYKQSYIPDKFSDGKTMQAFKLKKDSQLSYDSGEFDEQIATPAEEERKKEIVFDFDSSSSKDSEAIEGGNSSRHSKVFVKISEI